LIEGSAHKRHLLDAAPWDLEKLGKRTAKWALFVIATAIITHSFLAYFVGSGAITQMVMRPPSENWTSFLVILFSSAIVLFDFAWFREQFCIIACPYGRFQSVLMDENSLVIAYDQARGEPRWSTENKERAKASAAQLGDCVGCYRCVQVCPTGVDIRRGTQMECIACTSCIDACDEIMAKHKKPAGLIRYDSYNGLRGLPVKRLRIRTGIYIAIIAASLSALIYFLATLNPVDIKLLRAKDTPYSVVKQADGADEVINHYYLELSNQSAEAHSIELALAGKATQDGAEIAIAQKPIPLAAGQFARVDFFTKIPKAKIANGSYGTKLTIIDADSETGKATPYVKDLNLVGPFN
jgi:cytochrome c oxidase accessory protein FixG